jgi:hypothetical protein
MEGRLWRGFGTDWIAKHGVAEADERLWLALFAADFRSGRDGGEWTDEGTFVESDDPLILKVGWKR